MHSPKETNDKKKKKKRNTFSFASDVDTEESIFYLFYLSKPKEFLIRILFNFSQFH